MEATIKITSCSRVESWYKHRIGETFSAIIKNGTALVNNNLIFKVRQSEYEVMEVVNLVPQKAKYLSILNILEQGDMTADEVHTQYIKIYGRRNTRFIKYMIAYLKRNNKVSATGKRRVGHNSGRNQNVWTLKK